jgi:hypothetical protein
MTNSFVRRPMSVNRRAESGHYRYYFFRHSSLASAYFLCLILAHFPSFSFAVVLGCERQLRNVLSQPLFLWLCSSGFQWSQCDTNVDSWQFPNSKNGCGYCSLCFELINNEGRAIFPFADRPNLTGGKGNRNAGFAGRPSPRTSQLPLL